MLLVDPHLQERGWAQQLHHAEPAQARGLVRLKVHDRAELAQLCAANGWDVRHRWPGAVRLPGQRDGDGVRFTRGI